MEKVEEKGKRKKCRSGGTKEEIEKAEADEEGIGVTE